MDKYTVFIAQSGSGKSYFLCRLVEKIMLKSKARCLILDPDGDFRKLSSIDRQVWGSNQHIYDTKTARENSPTGVKMDLLKTVKKEWEIFHNLPIGIPFFLNIRQMFNTHGTTRKMIV